MGPLPETEVQSRDAPRELQNKSHAEQLNTVIDHTQYVSTVLTVPVLEINLYAVPGGDSPQRGQLGPAIATKTEST